MGASRSPWLLPHERMNYPGRKSTPGCHSICESNYPWKNELLDMVISTSSAWDAMTDEFEDRVVIEYENAIVYGDFNQEQILHRGNVRILPNGWIVLPTGRLLSPEAVHHIDP